MLDSVNWVKLKTIDQKDNQKDINTQVTVLNKVILTVFQNYVPSKYITVSDKGPVWMYENIKSKIKTRNLL